MKIQVAFVIHLLRNAKKKKKKIIKKQRKKNSVAKNFLLKNHPQGNFLPYFCHEH